MSSYAVYQIGYAIFGVGATPDAARADAAQWLVGGEEAAAAVPMYRRGEAIDGDVVIVPCSDALASQVMAQGGSDGFLEMDGGLVTVEEAGQAS